jgi:hypothetical protein
LESTKQVSIISLKKDVLAYQEEINEQNSGENWSAGAEGGG